MGVMALIGPMHPLDSGDSPREMLKFAIFPLDSGVILVKSSHMR